MILDGKAASSALFEKLSDRIKNLSGNPVLAVIQVGDNPASTSYINLKRKKATNLGFGFKHVHLPIAVTEREVANTISELNAAHDVTGIILQLPLPDHLQANTLLELISPTKDVDCLTTYSLGKFFSGNSELIPATPKGVIRLLDFNNISLEGKKVCIIGRSNLVGKPLSIGLLHRNATVTICHSKTLDIASFTKNADIVITAVGKPEFFGLEYFESHQVVIDIGTTMTSTGKLTGDVDFESVRDYVYAISPVPGGVGPMTVYGLFENLVLLSEKYLH